MQKPTLYLRNLQGLCLAWLRALTLFLLLLTALAFLLQGWGPWLFLAALVGLVCAYLHLGYRFSLSLRALDDEAATPAGQALASELSALNRFHEQLLGELRNDADQMRALLDDAVPELGELFVRLEGHTESQREAVAPFTHGDEASNKLDYRVVVKDVGDVMATFVDTIVDTSKISVRLVDVMQAISSETESIVGTLKELDAITAQTNLLAINAAIEAARAGDAGRGFAVVASEVQNLSKRAESFSEQIRDTVERARSHVRQAETAINEVASQDMNFSLQSKRSIDGLMDDMQDFEQSRQQAVDHLSSIADEVKADVGRIVTKMQFQDMVQQLLASLRQRVELLEQSQLRLAATSAASTDTADLTQQIRQERETLDRALSELRASPVQQHNLEDGSVELF